MAAFGIGTLYRERLGLGRKAVGALTQTSPLLQQPPILPFCQQGVAPARIALEWMLFRGGVMAIPMTSPVAPVEKNRAAADLVLSEEELRRSDDTSALPTGRTLEML